MKSKEMKPCPNPWTDAHCDHLNIYESEWHGEMMFYVGCGCGIHGPMSESEEGAVAAWNNRKSSYMKLNREQHWREAAEVALRKWSNLSEENRGVGIENTISNLQALKELKEDK